MYLKATNGRPFGRPPLGDPSKYLLTNLALCGCCQGPLYVRSRSRGTGRKYFYACSGYHLRGRTVCENGADAPMDDTNDVLIEALLDDVLDDSLVTDSVDEALRLLQGDDDSDRLSAIEAQIAKVDRERTRLVTAIATGGPLDGLLEALRAREYQRTALEADRSSMCSATRHAQLHKSGDARGHTGGHSDRNGRCEIRENRKREVVKSEAVLKWRPQRDSRPGAARLRGSFGRPDRMRSHMAFWAVYRWDRTHEPNVDVDRDQRDQESDRIGLGAVDREIRAHERHRDEERRPAVIPWRHGGPCYFGAASCAPLAMALVSRIARASFIAFRR